MEEDDSFRLMEPATAAALFIAAIVCAFMLSGCGDGSYEAEQQIALRNQRFFNSCLPEIDRPQVVEWKGGQLICFPMGKPRQPIVVTGMKDYD